MTFILDDPSMWPYFRPTIIAHDVGRTIDRSTAVVGGNGPFRPPLVGIKEFNELPRGLYGSARASALAEIDRRYGNNALIVADLSYDPSYAEPLLTTFGRRVIGLHITHRGDGMNAERRPTGSGNMLVYTIGRSQLLQLLLAELHSGQTVQRAAAHTASLKRSRQNCAIAGSSISALQDSMMISVFPVVYWSGLQYIRI